MMTTDSPRVMRDRAIERAVRKRAYVRLFATALAHPDKRKRQHALNAVKLYLQLREDCKEPR